MHLVTADETAAACPGCGVLSSSVKGHATTRPRDVRTGLRRCGWWHKRRWRCAERACPRASFTESIPEVPARAKMTRRPRAECGAGIAERFTRVQAGARNYGVSWPVGHVAFVAHVQAPLAAPLPPVRVLGIEP